MAVLAVLMAAGNASCVHEISNADELKQDELVKVHLQINTPAGSAPSSRALTDAQETAVNNITVLMFKADTHALQAVSTPTKESQTGNSVRFTASFNIDATLRNTPMDVVVLANVYGYDEATMKSWVTQHITYEALQQQLKCSIDDVTAARGIPMWGKSKTTFVPTQTTNDDNRLAVDMIRSVAKIDLVFKARQAGAAAFVPAKVHLVKPMTQMTLMPVWDKFTHGSGTAADPARVTGVSLPAGVAAGANKSVDITNGATWAGTADLSFLNTIYLAENDVFKGLANPRPGDEKHTERPAIIIEGRYGSDVDNTFYRLDFAEGTAGQASYALRQVLRNRNFKITVEKVLGRGYATLDEAYNSRSMYLQTTIADWNSFSDNIVYDGETSIEVSDKTLYFTHAKGETREVTVTASVPEPTGFDYTKWKMGWEFDKEAVRTIAGGWFTVANGAFEARIKAGATGNTATIQFRTTK